MATYVYKVNAKNLVGFHYGNWLDFYDEKQPSPWGLEDVVCVHHHPNVGDRIIAYQTNLRRIIGTAKVVGYRRGKIILKAVKGPFRGGPTITELKKRDRRIQMLSAFQQGFIRTLYEITDADADYLLSQVEKLHVAC